MSGNDRCCEGNDQNEVGSFAILIMAFDNFIRPAFFTSFEIHLLLAFRGSSVSLEVQQLAKVTELGFPVHPLSVSDALLLLICWVFDSASLVFFEHLLYFSSLTCCR